MDLVLKTQPTEFAISLDEAKKHLRVTVSAEDAYISSLIAGAQEHASVFLRRALMTTTYVRYWDSFPAARGHLPLAYPPVASVTHLKYVDVDGAEQTLVEGTDFDVVMFGLRPRLDPSYGKSWPTARKQAQSVWCEFVVGVEEASGVPQTWRQAMLLLIGHWYENREEVLVGTIAAELPVGAAALLRPFRIQRP